MGVRGFVKDVLFLFLAYSIFRIWLKKEQVGIGIISLTVIICILVIWFMLERIGLVPKAM